jgi:hypothetical protein
LVTAVKKKIVTTMKDNITIRAFCFSRLYIILVS